MSLSHYFTNFLPAIDAEMRRVVEAPDDSVLATYYGMLHYHLGWVDEHFKAKAEKYLAELSSDTGIKGIGSRLKKARKSLEGIYE